MYVYICEVIRGWGVFSPKSDLFSPNIYKPNPFRPQLLAILVFAWVVAMPCLCIIPIYFYSFFCTLILYLVVTQ